jgi:hypothetical protein
MVMIVGGLLACLALANPTEAVIRYVKAGATGSGVSWTDPSGDLRAAMNASQEFDQVWVAAGTYTPGDTRDLYFPLYNRVIVKGGFYADPQDPSARDPNPLTNGTVLSGDIGELGLAGDNSYCVVVATGTDRTTTMLDGFTITGGNGGYWNQTGAGIFVTGTSSPRLANLWIIGNQAPAAGAGVYVADGSPNFTDCRFENNRSGSGAALYFENSFAQLPITVDRCTFVSNTADFQAAALLNSCPEEVRVWNTIFAANRCLGDQPAPPPLIDLRVGTESPTKRTPLGGDVVHLPPPLGYKIPLRVDQRIVMSRQPLQGDKVAWRLANNAILRAMHASATAR